MAAHADARAVRGTPAHAQHAASFDVHAAQVFTTRPDTLMGATYAVIAPEHPLAASQVDRTDGDAEVLGALREYVTAASRRSDLERSSSKDKSGVFSGLEGWAEPADPLLPPLPHEPRAAPEEPEPSADRRDPVRQGCMSSTR